MGLNGRSCPPLESITTWRPPKADLRLQLAGSVGYRFVGRNGIAVIIYVHQPAELQLFQVVQTGRGLGLRAVVIGQLRIAVGLHT